jgi:hypothetical protein
MVWPCWSDVAVCDLSGGCWDDGLFCANAQDDESRTPAAARKNLLMTPPFVSAFDISPMSDAEVVRNAKFRYPHPSEGLPLFHPTQERWREHVRTGAKLALGCVAESKPENNRLRKVLTFEVID